MASSVKTYKVTTVRTPIVKGSVLAAHAFVADGGPEPSFLTALSSLGFPTSSSGDDSSDEDDDVRDVPDGQAEAAVVIEQYHATMAAVTGAEGRTTHAVLATETSARGVFFDAGCAYVRTAHDDEIWCTSKPLAGLGGGEAGRSQPVGVISKITLRRGGGGGEGGGGDGGSALGSVEWKKLRAPHGLELPAGAAAFRDGVVYCARGGVGPRAASSGVFFMPRGRPPQALVRGFAGKELNSPWGVAVETGGARDVLWFTDPATGGWRPAPRLPRQLYRLEVGADGEGVSGEDIRVMADGFVRPTGVAASADGRRVYVADAGGSGSGSGGGGTSKTATVYVFDVQRGEEGEAAVFLGNRRVFAFARKGRPRGVLVDDKGRVYVGCADEVEVFSSGGRLVGAVRMPGPVGGLCWGRQEAGLREMFVCGGRRLWVLRFGGLGSGMDETGEAVWSG